MTSIVRPSAFLLRRSCLALSNPARNAAFYSTSRAASSTTSPLAIASTLKPGLFQTKQRDVAVNVAGFHATSRRDLLPPPPQTIQGTMNDPAPLPPTSPSHGSYHWTFERAIAVALIPLTIAPFAGGSLNPVMDAVFCGTILMHSHIGFQSCIIDYIPGRRFPKAKKAFDWLLRVMTLTVAVGLYEFETNDVGVTEAIKRIWKA
ncbi:succinate dehydrogenase (ubiquinone) membrane anchor subunit [Blastomyces gilchristii SLH14081]|uniref:Succinate dehydrogenase [ubiquinone] cytochrome b small subunit n=1 Tax=Blastomyces gilchristii (strain SLH14081) TaxID=559298 RepID=A0A179URA2_BLAGS|nr:succinate dehydrogenase (ubiquinone) membrane anchor subunit [Blastomyces gilchristii SLH14081]OAT10635.1 succinate dehydrogenase (ubiquinone) membrane anchor subunit [Blastomyces gilchristii SLH14081]